LKLPSTSDQPFIRRGSDEEKRFVFSDGRNNEAINAVSDVRRACPNRPTASATSLLIAALGSGVGDGVGWIVGIGVGATVGKAVGPGIGMAVAVGSGVAVGVVIGVAVGTTVSSGAGWGSGVASPAQAVTRTARSARTTPNATRLFDPDALALQVCFN